MTHLLAAASSLNGDGLVRNLLVFLVVLVCCLLIYFVGKLAIGKLAGGATAMMFWNGLFLMIGLIVAINFLLSLIDKQFIRW